MGVFCRPSSWPVLRFSGSQKSKLLETDLLKMSYYRYITGVYKSYWPELNRTLRSSSVPIHVPEPVPCRSSRASSVPASEFYSDIYFSRGTSATPFCDRALSVPRQLSSSYDPRSLVSQPPATHYSDFDYKVIDYMSRLDKEDTVRPTSISPCSKGLQPTLILQTP